MEGHVSGRSPRRRAPDSYRQSHFACREGSSLPILATVGSVNDSIVSILRDFVRSPTVVSVVASAVGLVTVASWVFGDPSPFSTLIAGTQWLGIHVAGPLGKANAWLNDKQRLDPLVLASLGVLLVTTFAQAWREATLHRQYDACHHLYSDKGEAWTCYTDERKWVMERDFRYWEVTWIVTALLAQLHETSAAQVLAGLGVILVCRAISAVWDDRAMGPLTRRLAAPDGPIRPKRLHLGSPDIPHVDDERMGPGSMLVIGFVSVLFSLLLAFTTLVADLIRIWTLLTEPRKHVTTNAGTGST